MKKNSFIISVLLVMTIFLTGCFTNQKKVTMETLNEFTYKNTPIEDAALDLLSEKNKDDFPTLISKTTDLIKQTEDLIKHVAEEKEKLSKKIRGNYAENFNLACEQFTTLLNSQISLFNFLIEDIWEKEKTPESLTPEDQERVFQLATKIDTNLDIFRKTHRNIYNQ